jgi:hypothetical protein
VASPEAEGRSPGQKPTLIRIVLTALLDALNMENQDETPKKFLSAIPELHFQAS